MLAFRPLMETPQMKFVVRVYQFLVATCAGLCLADIVDAKWNNNTVFYPDGHAVRMTVVLWSSIASVVLPVLFLWLVLVMGRLRKALDLKTV